MKVPCDRVEPNTSVAVSVWVSKWTIPTGPCAAAQARTQGPLTEWSPPSVNGSAPAATTSPTSASMASWVRRGSVGITAASPKSITRSSAKASTPTSRCGPGGQLAARIARGAKQVPGRSETRSSIGAPTIATSAPASSAASSV